MEKHNHRLIIPFCLTATWLVWGSTYLAIKYALVSFSPFMLASLRYLIAGSVLLIIVKLQGKAWPSIRQSANAALIGILMTTLGNGLTCVAEKTMPSGATALIVATTPLLTIIINQCLGSRARPMEWYGILLGIVGMALINFDSSLAGDPRGVGIMIAACLSWAVASALIPRLDLPSGPMSSAIQMLAGGLAAIPVVMFQGDHLPSHLDTKALAALAYLVVFGSIIAYSAFVWLLRHVRPALATSSSYVNPVVALFLGWLIRNESIGWQLIVGIAIILTGVVLISRAHRR